MKILATKYYPALIERVKEVPFNNLFARAVTEGKIAGKVYVDNTADIKTAYISHPYGMTLLLGSSDNDDFNDLFRKYALNTENEKSCFEWMQTYPRTWDNKLSELSGDLLILSAENVGRNETGILELNTRVNFKFDKAAYIADKTSRNNEDTRIAATNKDLLQKMRGTVTPKYFWNTEDDFLNNGMAYSLLYKGELASMAFSSCWFEQQLEIGIETHPEFRGRGFAEIVCGALIDWCIENNLEPVWACRKENTGSYKLACKLGFRPVLELPYYRLSK